MLNVCDCIASTVTFRGICEEREDCVAYIDDVSGVTARMIELLADDLNEDGAKVVEKILANSAPDFVEYVRSKIGEKFTERTIFRDEFTGYWRTPHQLLGMEAGKLRGIFIDLEDSPYLYLNLADAEIFIGDKLNPGDGEELHLIDLDRGVVIDTFAYNAAPSQIGNFVQIPIGKKYFGYRRLFLGYTTEIASIESTVHGRGFYANLCAPCNCSSYARCGELDLAGSMTYDAIDWVSNCGIRVCYGVGCSLDGWICNNRARFAHAFKYKAATAIFEEITGSDRLNSVTNISEETLDILYQKAASKMERAVTNIAKGSSFDCKFCFPCDQNRTKKVHFRP